MTWTSRHKRELGVLAACLALLATQLAALVARHGSAAVGQFADQLLNSTLDAAPLLVVAVGVTLVMVARQIDISVGSQVSVLAIAVALFARGGVPTVAALPVAIAIGAAFGAVNGVLVALARLPAVVVTLATMMILRQSLTWARGGAWVDAPKAGFQWLGIGQAGGTAVVLLIAGVLFAAATWATHRLAAGRTPYAVGSDAEAARLAGIRPAAVVFWLFVLAGGLCGVAAWLAAVVTVQVPTNVGEGKELMAIAAVVVGGTSVTGGRGTLFGTVAGVLLLVNVAPTLSFV
ncbi:MAG TPA: ABC transporter permease, partial [Humisphaera sp.]